MMIFSAKSKAFIENSVLSWGTEEQRRVWLEWSDKNPQIRRGPDDPVDDGTGSIPDALRDAIVDCTRQWALFLVERTKLPTATEDQIADDCNDAALLRCIGTWVSGHEVDWW